MYKLKAIPEDFVVTERTTIIPKEEGRFCYAWLQKRNLTTLEAIERLAKALHIPTKRIGYAGNKDKRAVTEQLVSVEGVAAEKIEALHIPAITLTTDGYGDRVVGLGALTGNEFKIVVRNILEGPRLITQFPNYFDAQRFSAHNAEIGKFLIQRKFTEALKLMQRPSNNPLQELRKLPKKLLLLYVHAYQSLLFNRILAESLRSLPHVWIREPYGELVFPQGEVQNFTIPLPGFGYTCADAALEQITQKILQDEGIAMQDFIIRELPDLSCESIERQAFAPIADLKINKLSSDNLDRGKKKCTLSFFLPKGSYATMVIRAMFV